MSDSDEDEFASYGTLLEPYEQDEIPAKKAFNIEEQVATDAQGRRRFHGAFTGGFSAGYFNTVGSSEGWKPTEFKSSRAEKAEKKLQKATDYMDEEDLGEFGIAPTQVRATSDYAPQVRKRTKNPDGPIPGVPVLHSLLQPAKDTVGIKLLKKMGWKPGQGIGPRLSKSEKLKANREHRMNAGRVYGCEIPEEFRQKIVENEESSEDETDLTFAPDDYDPFIYKPKDNSFGMGYSGLDKRPILSSHISLFAEFEMKDKNNKKISITGQAFGVGAFEHEDEDIYTKDDMTKYDFEMDTPKSKKKTPKKLLASSEKILDGFTIARIVVIPKKAFPAPVLPKNFVPKHGVRISRFEPLPETHKLFNYDRKKTMGRHDLTATQRSKILNSDANKNVITATKEIVNLEKSVTIPVLTTIERIKEFTKTNSSKIILNKMPTKEFVVASLDLTKSPKEFVLASTSKLSSSTALKTPVMPTKEFVTSTLDATISEENKVLLEKAAKITSNLPNTASVFKPFIANPDKQNRYEQYISLMKLGQRDKLSDIQPPSLTDWEKEHEHFEFEQAARLYRPHTGLVFDKFVAATEQEDINDPLKRLGKSIFQHGTSAMREAAKQKKFGHLTREVTVWIPDKILCKRFNVPDPETSESDMLKSRQKKNKFSVFDYYEAYQQNKVPTEGPEPQKQPENQTENTILTPIPDDNKDPIIPSSSNTQNTLKPIEIKTNLKLAPEIKTPINITETINTFNNIDIPSTSSYLEDLFTEEPINQVAPNITPNVVRKIPLPEPKIVIPTDPKEKLDLFKAIFLSSSESEDENEETLDTNKEKDKIVEMKKIILEDDNMKTAPKIDLKPSKGILANLDWSKVNRNKLETVKKPEPVVEIDDESYGPKLPVYKPEVFKESALTTMRLNKGRVSSSSEEEWMEIDSEKRSKKTKKQKCKHKKHKCEKHKGKSTHKSKHKNKKHSDKD